jgi:hypothetical protein
MRCSVFTFDGDHVTYTFAASSWDDLLFQASVTETAFTKNGQPYGDHQPRWRARLQGEFFVLTSEETPDWALVLGPVPLRKTDPTPVRLLHGRNVTGQGACGNALDAKVTPRPDTPAAPTRTPTPYTPPTPSGQGGDYVPIYSVSGKGAAVDVTLGSQPLRMLIDTGATMMSLPWDVAMALIASGDAEFGPKESFRLADGSIREEWTIIIRRMTIGSHVLTNVRASVRPRARRRCWASPSLTGWAGSLSIWPPVS